LVEHSLGETFDAVVVPALALSEQDRHGGSLPENSQTFIIESTTEIVKNLLETADETETDPSLKQSGESEDAKVLCLPAKDEADEVAANMLSILLNKKGIPARAASAKTLLNETLDQMEAKHVTIVCISCVPPSGLRHARYLCKRVRSRFRDVKIVMGVWGSPEDVEQIKQRLHPVAIDAVVLRMSEAVEQAAAMTTITESMLPAPVPESEHERLEELKRLGVLDSPPEVAYENITRELARTFNVPISLVTLVDEKRQVWKAQTGLPPDLAAAHSGAREESICGHVVAANEMLIVPDLLKDKRFAGNPFVKERGIRFYAGVPLRTHAGQAIGSLCIIDTKPHELSEGEKAYLQMMAERIIDEMELRASVESKATTAQP
ncbi:MAG TPA: GAF domain-containing protein, partial [Candidatus Saccharimonadales bacterium]|nr:GAF domain-containing protein [Candidatus Saccharimonadales bacterium]